MAAPHTDTSALALLVQAAYDRKVRQALRSIPTFRGLCDVRPANQTAPGSSVTISILPDLTEDTSVLSETSDDNETLLGAPTQVDVTLNEYGAYTVVSNKLGLTTFDDNLSGNVALKIANQMNDSVDSLVRAVLDDGTNVLSIENDVLKTTVTLNSILAGDTFDSRAVRYAVTKLRGASVMPWQGSAYGAYVHPDVSHDLKAESGAGGWRLPQEYSSVENIQAGEIGQYEGAFFIENPRCKVAANTAGTPVNVYNSYILGREAVAEVVAQDFGVVLDGVISDPLKRKQSIGWYGVAGWSLFQADALRVVKTASSVA